MKSYLLFFIALFSFSTLTQAPCLNILVTAFFYNFAFWDLWNQPSNVCSGKLFLFWFTCLLIFVLNHLLLDVLFHFLLFCNILLLSFSFCHCNSTSSLLLSHSGAYSRAWICDKSKTQTSKAHRHVRKDNVRVLGFHIRKNLNADIADIKGFLHVCKVATSSWLSDTPPPNNFATRSQ